VAASISVRVCTGTDAGTESTAVTGIDHISADNAINSLANRQDYPLSVGSRAFEKWVRLHIDVAPANNVSNFQAWGTGTVDEHTTLYCKGEVATGATPTASVSTVATLDWTDYTAAAKLQWDDGTYTAINDVTEWLVFQLAIGASAVPGGIAQHVYSYSYDET
jgi:hypothetical protein